MVQAERKKKQSEAELQQYQHDWKQHVLRLKAYFDSQGLQNVDPLGMTRNSLHAFCSLINITSLRV